MVHALRNTQILSASRNQAGSWRQTANSSVIFVHVQTARPLGSPAYDLDENEAQVTSE